MVILTVLLATLVACESSDEQSTTINDESEINNLSEDTEIGEKNKSEVQDKVADQMVAENNGQDKNPSESKESIQITNGEEAVQYLKQHLIEGTNDDVSFGTDGKLETDNIGSYYTVQLVNIPLRVSGKTENLGYYKVYQDGIYEPYQSETSNNSSRAAVNNKKEYHKILNDTEKEMKEFLKNSESTTTLDMEKDGAHRYKIWDTKLNEIYGILKEQLNKEQMDKLRDEQRNWIKFRDETAKKASLEYKGGSMESLEYVATQATLTKERCYALVGKYMK